MPVSLSFWAKLGNETWPEKYHPVICHLIDVAAVARSLWDNVFRPHFRQWLAARLGLDESDCAQWAAFWVGAHDIGKVAPCFQDRNDCRTIQLKEKLLKNGFAFHTWDRPHGTISAAILAEHRAAPPDWPQLDERLANRVAVAVGGHHGLFPSDWADVLDLLRSPPQPSPLDAAQCDILRMLARFLQTPAKAAQPIQSDDQAVFMALAGLTSVADWIGSNQEFFAPAGDPKVAAGQFDLQTYFRHAQKQAQCALRQLGWLDREPFGERSGNLRGIVRRHPLRPAAAAAAGRGGCRADHGRPIAGSHRGPNG